MIDYAKIIIKAGDGGNGAGSFTGTSRAKRLGRADGGDGARGGNVYFVATRDLNTLERFRFVKEYKAANGVSGLSNLRRGAVGADLEVKVPVGTQIRVTSQSEESKNRKDYPLSTLTFDLIEDGQKILLARGGEGGRGNAHLRDEFRRRPKAGEKGQPGEEVELTLELKVIADVGLVGLPNAGKSTLIAALTSARPRIANYPFTTLEPNLGVLEVKVESQSGESKKQVLGGESLPTVHSDSRLVLADIPGLIEGASEGKGLGDIFLRHIERTKILAHLIDVSEVGDVWETYTIIRNELKAYSAELLKKKEIIVLNKIDLVDSQKVRDFVAVFSGKKKKALAISAVSGEGLEELKKEIVKKL